MIWLMVAYGRWKLLAELSFQWRVKVFKMFTLLWLRRYIYIHMYFTSCYLIYCIPIFGGLLKYSIVANMLCSRTSIVWVRFALPFGFQSPFAQRQEIFRNISCTFILTFVHIYRWKPQILQKVLLTYWKLTKLPKKVRLKFRWLGFLY